MVRGAWPGLPGQVKILHLGRRDRNAACLGLAHVPCIQTCTCVSVCVFVCCVCGAYPYLRTLSVSVGLGQATSCPLQKGGPRPLLLVSCLRYSLFFHKPFAPGGFVGEGEVERTSKTPRHRPTWSSPARLRAQASVADSGGLSAWSLSVRPSLRALQGGSNAAAEPHQFISSRQAFHQASIWPSSEIQGLHQSLPLSEIRGIGPWAVAEFRYVSGPQAHLPGTKSGHPPERTPQS